MQRTVCEKRRGTPPSESAVNQSTTDVSPIASFEDQDFQDANRQSGFLARSENHQTAEQQPEPTVHQASPTSLPDLTHSPISPVSSIPTEAQGPFMGLSRSSFPAKDRQQRINIVNGTASKPFDPDMRLDAYDSGHNGEVTMLDVAIDELRYRNVEQWLSNSLSPSEKQSTPGPLLLDDGTASLQAANHLHGRSFLWSCWEQPQHREVLLRSIAQIMRNLPPFVKRIAWIDERDPQACVDVWNGEWCSAWDECEKDLSAEDLPAFLYGWMIMLADHAKRMRPGLDDHTRQFKPKPVGKELDPTTTMYPFVPEVSRENTPFDSVIAVGGNEAQHVGRIKSRKRNLEEQGSQEDARWGMEACRRDQEQWARREVGQASGSPVFPPPADL